MMVMLPLRALAGDAMATQMAGVEVAIKIEAASAHNTLATAAFDLTKQAPHDCHGSLAGLQDTSNNVSDSQGNQHSKTCQACQACHTVALPHSHIISGVAFASPTLWPTSVATFTSADAALGQKPPIV